MFGFYIVQINWVNTKICIFFFFFALIKFDKWVDTTNPFNKYVALELKILNLFNKYVGLEMTYDSYNRILMSQHDTNLARE